MKIRSGFVSNSSSSSFVCAICDGAEYGELDEVEMVECPKCGNIIHYHCCSDYEKVERAAMKSGGECPEELCPICSFSVIARYDKLKYVFKKLGITEQDAENEILNRFINYDQFCKFMNK